jgi:hypothetical protein
LLSCWNLLSQPILLVDEWVPVIIQHTRYST